MPTVYDEIIQLKDLLDKQVITQDEFNAKKTEILRRDTAIYQEKEQAAATEAAIASSPKSKIAAGLLAIFLGTLGIHKFYLGYSTQGIIMLLVSLLTLGIGAIVMGIIALVEGIIYLTKSDADFYAIYVEGRKAWF